MAKKIKKVETPIDQHETFVSLQKNFADSEISVEEKLKTLYELQKADSDIDKIMQLRGELPAEVETLEAEVAQMKAKQAQLTAMIDEYNKSIAVNKQNIFSCSNAHACIPGDRYALILLITNTDVLVSLNDIGDHFHAFISSSVVYKKNFKGFFIHPLPEKTFQTHTYIFFDVIYRNDNA